MKYDSDDHITLAILGEIFIIMGFALLCNSFRGSISTLLILGGMTMIINVIAFARTKQDDIKTTPLSVRPAMEGWDQLQPIINPAPDASPSREVPGGYHFLKPDKGP